MRLTMPAMVYRRKMGIPGQLPLKRVSVLAGYPKPKPFA